MNKRTEDEVSQARGGRRIGTSVIRERCCAPQFKLVHCGVELVRDYCSLHPALNLSYCSGSAPSCVRLFEVGKSCSHVLLMLSLSVCLSFFCLSLPCFSLNTEEEKDLEHCILFVLHPPFRVAFWLFILGRGVLILKTYWKLLERWWIYDATHCREICCSSAGSVFC